MMDAIKKLHLNQPATQGKVQKGLSEIAPATKKAE